MPPPKVTVLLSAHNAASTLAESVRSVLAQTMQDFELVVVDDGSTDDTPAVLAAFCDPRLQVISLTQNIGLTRALNVGLAKACGNYIARLDADDTAHPDRLAAQVAVLDRNPGVVLVSCAHEIRPPEGPPVVLCEPADETALRFGLLFDNTIHHPTVMLRRSVFTADLPGYDPAFPCAQDYALWARLKDRGHITKLREPLVVYGHGPGRVSVRRADEQRAAARAISLGLMRSLLPARNLQSGDRDAAALAWPACPVPATAESLRGSALVLDLFRAFFRDPFIRPREARRMRRAWLLRVLNSIRISDLRETRRSGFLSAAFTALPFTVIWYAALRLGWVVLHRLGFRNTIAIPL
jgi:glycosyltransferase involved in cell wall biosynthesis